MSLPNPSDQTLQNEDPGENPFQNPENSNLNDFPSDPTADQHPDGKKEEQIQKEEPILESSNIIKPEMKEEDDSTTKHQEKTVEFEGNSEPKELHLEPQQEESKGSDPQIQNPKQIIDADDIPIRPQSKNPIIFEENKENPSDQNQEVLLNDNIEPPKKKPPSRLGANVKKPPPKKKPQVIKEEDTSTTQQEITSQEKPPFNLDIDENPPPKLQATFDDMPIQTKKLDIDEIPIGKSTKFDISEYPPDYNPEENKEQAPGETQNIPLSDRLKSKVWKIRQSAFEELNGLLQTMEPSEMLQNFPFSDMAKYLADSNPGAQEKALGCFKLYLKKREKVEEEFEEVLKVLVDKVMVSPKNNIKKAGSEILLELFLKAHDRKAFVANYPALFNNKNPKTAATAIASFVEIFQNFGVRKLDFLKPWLAEIEKVASNSNVAGIKQECMNFFKEAYLFVGPDLMKMNTGKLKKTQLDELEKFYAENPFTEPKKPIQSVLEEEDLKHEAKGDGKKNQNKQFDAYEISDPVDIFHKYGEAWTAKILAFEKWNERKEALEEFLRENSNVIKISNNQPSTVSTFQMMLKRLLMDSNVQVTISAIKIIGFLSKGMRRSFYSQAKALFPFLLERLREKKGMLLDETQKTLENMLFSLNLDEVMDLVKETLEGKNVQGKLNGLIWVEKALAKAETLLANMKSLMPVFKKLLDDGSNEVRTLMMSVMGRIAAKIVGDKTLFNFIMKEVPESKVAKLEEIVKKTNTEKEEITVKKESQSSLRENPKDTKEKSIVMIQKEQNKEDVPIPKDMNINKSSLLKENQKKPSPDPPKKKAQVLEDSGYEDITNICEEEAERILKEKGFEDILKGLSHPDWKEKQKAIVSFADYQEAIFQNLEEFLVVLRLKLKQFKEGNLGIMKELFNFIGSQALLDKINNKSFNVIGTLILEKASEAKFSEQITQILCKSSKNISLKWIIPNLLGKLTGKASANVKVTGEMLEQFNKLLLYVSNPKENPLKELLAFVKGLINSTNVALKGNLTNILNTLIDLHGKTLVLTNLGEIPSNFLKNLKDEEEKKEEPEESQPTITISKAESATGNPEKPKKTLKELMEEKDKAKNGAKATPENNKKELLRKESGPIKSSLIKNTPKDKEKATPDEKVPKKSESKANLALTSEKKTSLVVDFNKIFTKIKHKEWNIRKEGLEELDACDFAKFNNNTIIEILNILKIRLTDPNKPLARQFVVFCGNFCKGLDKDSLKPHFKNLLMSLLGNLSDKNPTVRQEIINTLKLLNGVVGQDVSINLISQYYLNGDSPEMKSELLKFIRENDLNNEKIEFKHLINPVLSCIIDKNKEIRGNAELLLRKLLEKIGRSAFIQQLRDMKPAQKSQIEAVFEKIAEGMRTETEVNEKSLDLEEKKSRKSIGVVSKGDEGLLEVSGHRDMMSISGVKEKDNSGDLGASKTKINKNPSVNNLPPVSELMEDNFEELLAKEKGLFVKDVSELHESKLSRMQKLEVVPAGNNENNEKNTKKIKIAKTAEAFHCLSRIKRCLEVHQSHKCPLQSFFAAKKNSEMLIFEVFSAHGSNFQSMISPFFYQKLYCNIACENNDFFEGLRFLNKLFQLVLAKEHCVVLQSIDEVSDILIQYISFMLMKAIEISEEQVVLALDTLLFLIKIIRFNCNHLSPFELLFLLSITRVLLDGNLDNNAFIQKPFKTFFLSMICNCKDLQFLQEVLNMFFLLSDPNNWSLRHKILRYLNELVFDYTEPDIEALGPLPEVAGDRETLVRFVGKFNEEELLKKSGLSRNQLSFGKKSGNSADPKTQELDKMINETKNSIIRRNTHTTSLFKDTAKSIRENINRNSESMFNRTPDDTPQLRVNEKNDEEKLEKISEDLLKNPIVNQQITSELFLADLKLLEEGNPAQKIDALMFLSDLATSGLPEHGLLFQRHADQILVSFGFVFKKAFSLEMRLSLTERFPLQFLQYFLNMFQKLISAGLFLRYVKNNQLLKEFLEDVLLKILWEENFINRNFTGVHSGVMLSKLMNILVLRTLEYGDHNGIMEGLLELLYKYRKINANCYRKLYGLITKCLLKLGSHIGMLKENKQEVDIERILELFYRYLSEFFEEEDVGVMTIKGVLYEICKSFGEKVWGFYKRIELKGTKNDYLLEKWISMIMKTVNPNINGNQEKNSSNKKETEEEISKILNKIKEKDIDYDTHLMKLAEIIESYPDFNMDSLMQTLNFEKSACEYIKKAIQKLIFIKKCPWVAEENKIFHKGVNLTEFAQAESNQAMQNYNFRLRFLNEKYHEIAELMDVPKIEKKEKIENEDDPL